MASSSSRRLAAIMFTDLEGFTSRTQKDEAGALRLLDAQQRLVGPVLAAHHGRAIKAMGDGMLVEFPNARDAIECAVALQRALSTYNASAAENPLRMRIGVHLGDVEERGNDILGDAVNIASRIEPLAEVGGVCCSAQVYDQVHNKVPFRLAKLGPRRLKGLEDPVDIYRVELPWAAAAPVPAAPGPSVPRLAVLPLSNISPDPKDEYLADGLTEELISVLSQVPGLRVIARTSVNQYKGTAKPVSQIGAELGASSVLEGSVRKAGARLRITLQLIDVASQEHTWSESYNRDLEDIFAIQADIAERTAAALRLKLEESDRTALLERNTKDLGAYEAYLRGIREYGAYLDAVDAEAARRSIAFFEQAIARDPGFALAQAYLANVLLAVAGELLPFGESFPRARSLIDRALELHPNSAEARVARGNLAMQADLDWPRAEAELRRAISINPSSWSARYWYASLLEVLQRYSEAEVQTRAAAEQNPMMLLLRASTLTYQALSGRVDLAIEGARAMAEASGWPKPFRAMVASLYLFDGKLDEAREILAPIEGSPELPIRSLEVTVALFSGDPAPARALLAELEERRRTEFVPDRFVVPLLALLGRRDEAIALLEGDFADGDHSLFGYYPSLGLNPIRRDARFVALLERAGIPTTTPWPWAALLPPGARGDPSG